MCSFETTVVQCDDSCAREGYLQCDGFACPTGQCIRTSVTYMSCTGGSGGGDGSSDPGGYPSGGGSDTDPYSYYPNNYDNPVYDDPNYINALKRQYFWEDLDYGSQLWAVNNPMSYNEIIQYLIQNNWSTSAQLTINQLIELCRTNNSTFTVNNSITAQNSISFNNVAAYQTYLNNFNDSSALNIATDDNGNNTKTSRFKFDLGVFAYLNVSVKQKLKATGQSYSIESVSSSISGATLAMEWHQNNDDDLQVSSNIATITFTGTLSLNCFVEGIGVFFSDNVTIVCNFNTSTGALISAKLIGLD